MIVFVISTSLMVPGAAFAAAPRRDKAPPSSPAVEALAACRAIADNVSRLACFDQASARFAEAVGNGEVVVMDKQEVRQTRRSLFGFALPRIALFRGDDTAADQDEIETKITAATGLGYDKYRIRIEDGAVWETTEGAPINPPRAGQKIVIKRGALGNYFLRIDGQKAVRGRRTG